MTEKKRLTTNFGKPVGDDQNSQTVGSPGYTLLSDVHLHDKLSHFNRERIPEAWSTPRGPEHTATSKSPTM